MVKSSIFKVQFGVRELLLDDIGTNNVTGDEFNPILVDSKVRLYNLQKTFQRGVTGYGIILRTMCHE